MNKTNLHSPTNNLNNSEKIVKISLQIPQKYHDVPVISSLAIQDNLQVNILGAILGENCQGDGWFTILLKGPSDSINHALNYLEDLDIKIWDHYDQDGELTNDWDIEGWIVND
jgi:ABC-type methionine transport system ATPase subunit